jgi:hypothetical protein
MLDLVEEGQTNFVLLTLGHDLSHDLSLRLLPFRLERAAQLGLRVMYDCESPLRPRQIAPHLRIRRSAQT